MMLGMDHLNPGREGQGGMPPYMHQQPAPLHPGAPPGTPGMTYPGNYRGYGAMGPAGYPNPGCPGVTDPGAGVYDPEPVSPPPPRERFSYTRYQLELMNGIYRHIRYPNSMQKQLIAKRVGITRDQVKIWFQNRRRKDVVERNGTSKKTGAQCKLTSSSDSEADLDGVKMVPDTILNGIIAELLKYENDPKGKKALEAMKQAGRGEGEDEGRTRRKRKAEDGQSGGEAGGEDGGGSRGPKSAAVSGGFISDGLMHVSSYSPISSTDHNSSLPSTASSSSPESTAQSPPAVLHPTAPPPAVPSSEQLDMVAPPNTTIRAPFPGLPSSPSEDSLDEGGEESSTQQQQQRQQQPSTDFIPPNKVAPASDPVLPPSSMSTAVELSPLCVHIPGSSAASLPPVPGPTPSLMAVGYWQPPHSRQEDIAPQGYPPEPQPERQWHLPAVPGENSVGVGQGDRVFPFPVVAEPARYLPAMSSAAFHDAFPATPYLDPYQQSAVITSYNNPGIHHYDAAVGWSAGSLSKAKSSN